MADPAVIGYWFSGEDNKLGHGDDRIAVLGQKLTIEPPIVPHERGLHLSGMPWNALEYAPGPIAWLVQGGGLVIPCGNSEYACSERTPLARHDLSQVMSDFARGEAALVMNYWDCPPEVTDWLLLGEDRDTASAKMTKFLISSRDAWAQALKNKIANEGGLPSVKQSTERSLSYAACVTHAVDAAYYSTLPQTQQAAWMGGRSAALAQPEWANAIEGAAGRFYEYVRRAFNA